VKIADSLRCIKVCSCKNESARSEIAQLFGLAASPTGKVAQLFGLAASPTGKVAQLFGLGASPTGKVTQLFGEELFLSEKSDQGL